MDKPKNTPIQEDILQYLRQQPKLWRTKTDIIEALHKEKTTIRDALLALTERQEVIKVITKSKVYKNTKITVYKIKEEEESK